MTSLPNRAQQAVPDEIPFNSLVSRLFIEAKDVRSGKFAGSRTVSIKDPKYEKGETIKNELPLLTELHTPYAFEKLPQQHLISLTLNLELYDKPIPNLNIKKLPEMLSVLRLRLTAINKPCLDVDCLPHLKYFVLSDPDLTSVLAKKHVTAAIKKNMRMLCLLTSNCRKNYSKLGNWEHRLETDDSHLFPQLRRHYLAYRQRLLQAVAMERSAFGRMLPVYRQNILEAVAGKEEREIDEQFP